jgi:glucose-1-phosphate thymidylyltransferase
VRVVGVVPAAGRASRLQPLDCSKELLPVGGRPVMDYVIKRMRAVSPAEVRVVTRREKRDVVARAEELGATVVLARPATLSASVLAGTDDLAAEDVVLLGFPDTIWEPVDGFATLIRSLQEGSEAALGLFDFDEPERCDVVTLDEAGAVTHVTARPRVPPSNLVWGCAAFRARVLHGLRPEDEVAAYLDLLARRGAVGGVRLSGVYFDIGTKEALARAQGMRGGGERG